MLNLRVDIDGDRVVVAGLQKLADDFPDAVDRGLTRAAKGIHRAAHSFLSGPGKKSSNIPGGGYPVPVRTGHLRRMLGYLPPNASKSKSSSRSEEAAEERDRVGFSTGKHEAIIFNAAAYGEVIHDGRGSSAKFGARPFLTDALEAFNRGKGVAGEIDDEIAEIIKKRGFD